MMEKRLLIYKTALLIIGSIVAAYGIMLAMGAGFGGATLAVLWQGMSVTFGMSLGMDSFIVAAAMLIISLFYDRRQINAGTIVYQIIYSFFVDVFAKINVYPEQAWLRLAVMCVGIIIFAAGTGAYAAADLGKGSYEALTFSLAEKITGPSKLSVQHWMLCWLFPACCLEESLAYVQCLLFCVRDLLFSAAPNFAV